MQEQERVSAGHLERIRKRWNTYLRGKAGREAIPGLVMFLVAVLFARTPVVFGAYPLGLALLSSSRKHTLSVFFGLCVGALTLGRQGIVWGVVYMVALLMRLLLSLVGEKKEFFCERPQLQLLTSVVVATASCGYELAVSGINGSTLTFSMAMLVGSGVLCAVFSGVFSWDISVSDILGGAKAKPKPHTRLERIWMEAGVCLLLFFLTFSLKEFSIFGLNPGYLVAAFVTLFLSRRFGALKGCVGGLLISMGASTLYAPAFGLLGLVSGLIWPMGAFYAVGLGTAVGIVWCSYIEGLGGFLGVAPELTVAALIALPLIPKLYSSAIASEVKQDRADAEDAVRVALERQKGEERNLGRLSGAFDTLSRVLADRKNAPSREECFSLCDRVCTGYCANCGGRGACWDSEERPGALALVAMATCLEEGRPLTRGQMPTHLIAGCEQLEPLLAEVRLEGAKLWQARDTVCYAEEYGAFADLLRSLGVEKTKEERQDFAAANEIRRLLADKNMRAVAVRVVGERHRKVTMAAACFAGKQKELMGFLPQIGRLCGCHLSPFRFDTTGDVVVATAQRAPRFKIEVAFASRAAKSGDVSGDSVATFTAKEEGYTYVLLSDGMGTGREAAKTAGLCTLFLEKLLSAGLSQEIALKMLNRLVARGGEELSATIDLMTFDTYEGKATFMKSGAAASYVRRDGNLFRLRSRTIPIGIVEELDAEKLQFDTQAGDVVIMLSDGISQTSEDAPWLIEMLSRPLTATLEGVANAVLNEAENHLPQENGVAIRDDMTVVLAKVLPLTEK